MDEVSPFEPTLVGAVGRHWRLVLAIVAVVVIPTAIIAFTRPATYSATASLTVGDPRGPGVLNGQDPVAADRYVADQLAVFRSATLGERAAQRARQQRPPLSKSPGWFVSHTSASATAQNSNVISVKFAAPHTSQAMQGVRAVVDAYGDVVRAAVADQANAVKTQLDASIQSVDAQLAKLQGQPNNPAAASQIQQLTDSRVALAGRRAQVAAEANFPANGVGQTLLPSQARTAGKTAALRIVVVALVLGLLIGVAVAYVRSYRKRVFAHARDPELVLGVPLLVDASRRRSADVFGRPRSPDNGAAVVAREHEMYAIAATLLVDQLFEKEETGHSLAVVAAHDGPTCSAVAWRSAAALASRGLRVLLIDADGSREPTEAWITTHAVERRTWTKERADGTFALSGADSSPGTAPSSTGVSAQVGSSKGSLSFCRGLPPARSSKILGEVFRELGDDSDVVLVNAPPFLASADAANLASAVEHVLIAVPDESSVTDHEELSRRLRLASAVPIGYIYCSREPDLAATTEDAKIEQIDRNDSRIDRTVNALCKALFGADETTIVEKPQADEG